MVDAASVEGRDPIEDVHAIMDELSAYNPELLKLPQAIAANKLDAVYDEGADPLADLKKEFERWESRYLEFLLSAAKV